MYYLFSGRLALVLNKNLIKMGSKAFYYNQVWLLKNGYKRYCKLNLLYYKAYLFSLGYLAYRHLFGLKRYMRNSDDVAYWYNSVQAIDYIKCFQELDKRWINPVDYLSIRFSSFRYQKDTYHRVYDYQIKDLVTNSYLKKYYSRGQLDTYYFIGNPVLDVLHVIFSFNHLSQNPFKDALSEMRWDWINYMYTARNQLRSSKLDFRGYFHHYPDVVENHYRFKKYSPFFLLGYPEQFLAFPVVSSQYKRYTHNFTKNLNGYTNHLEISWYKLYGIDVIFHEVSMLEKFSKIGSPVNGFCENN